MPTYEYECEKCSIVVEEFKPMNKIEEHPKCPKCGGDTKRILGATPGFVH